MKLIFPVLSSVVLSSIANTSWACAVCGSQDEQAAGTYLAMTVFLSLLPLSLIGGVGYMIWNGAKQAAAIEAAEQQPAWKNLVLNPSASEDANVFPKNNLGLPY
jgi:hypothetical protein